MLSSRSSESFRAQPKLVRIRSLRHGFRYPQRTLLRYGSACNATFYSRCEDVCFARVFAAYAARISARSPGTSGHPPELALELKTQH